MAAQPWAPCRGRCRGAGGARGAGARDPHGHALRVLVGQLVPAPRRGSDADGAVRPVSADAHRALSHRGGPAERHRTERSSPGRAGRVDRGRERATRDGDRVHLRLAVDYSARDAILRAAGSADGRRLSREDFRELLARAHHAEPATPDVDLLIRTGREKRLSDFLLWECAYAELLFMDRLWPDFMGEDLAAAVEEFRRRDRRFGGLPNRGDDATTSAAVVY